MRPLLEISVCTGACNKQGQEWFEKLCQYVAADNLPVHISTKPCLNYCHVGQTVAVTTRPYRVELYAAVADSGKQIKKVPMDITELVDHYLRLAAK
ncbi:hypothetical protein HZB02_00590 [Candidatus Woesearchaeota archaeon]|nr:hypothetical protein [Candidatus Woesearchaeota archaeon]